MPRANLVHSCLSLSDVVGREKSVDAVYLGATVNFSAKSPSYSRNFKHLTRNIITTTRANEVSLLNGGSDQEARTRLPTRVDFAFLRGLQD
ncbi:hypothetical protein CC2G_014387 [Coprinopsis cinerea AmutBmut pab1-1]|nr:hypothetical protein CC2G_014387 [Coprinopsis cinerea AmutBmut pab1-1]